MREKNYNVEIIRMLSFLFVIVIHVSNYYSRAYGEITQGEYLFSVCLNAVARVSVPCFFMISGALTLGMKPNLGKNLSRILRFFIVLVFWSVIYYLFNTFYMGTPFDLWDVFSTPVEAHLWYLYALLPIYFVLPFFQIMCYGMTEKYDRAFMIMGILVIISMWFASLLHTEAYYDVPLLGDRSYAFYFFTGYFIQKYRERISWRFPVLASVFAVSTLAQILLTVGITRIRSDHYERLLEYGCPFVMISGISFFMMLYKMHGGRILVPEKIKHVIDMLCSCSFGIYLIHILFLDIYKKAVEPEQFSAFLAIPILTAVILALSILCVRLIRRLPGGKYIT